MNEVETRATLFLQHHLDSLHDIIALREPVEWAAAKQPRAFARNIGAGAALIERLPEKAETRDQLLRAQLGGINDVEAFSWRILAWGGMRVNNGKMLFKGNAAWIDHCANIASGALDRASAYDGFARLRKAGQTKGLGPAYFTKLIYFLTPRQPKCPIGFIMDQWVGCSINLLVQSPFIKIGTNFVVTDRNDGCIYERYCLTIEQLAVQCGVGAEGLEMQLMSKGGKAKGLWRDHVIKHRKPCR